MRVANRGLHPGSRIVGFELELWEWDFVADAANPTHGDLVKTYAYPPTSPR
jgi:hypothetical protein